MTRGSGSNGVIDKPFSRAVRLMCCRSDIISAGFGLLLAPPACGPTRLELGFRLADARLQQRSPLALPLELPSGLRDAPCEPLLSFRAAVRHLRSGRSRRCGGYAARLVQPHLEKDRLQPWRLRGGRVSRRRGRWRRRRQRVGGPRMRGRRRGSACLGLRCLCCLCCPCALRCLCSLGVVRCPRCLRGGVRCLHSLDGTSGGGRGVSEDVRPLPRHRAPPETAARRRLHALPQPLQLGGGPCGGAQQRSNVVLLPLGVLPKRWAGPSRKWSVASSQEDVANREQP